MSYVCLWSPVWRTGAGLGADLAALLPAVLSEVAPRLRLESERVWADARGLDALELAHALVGRLAAVGVEEGRAGVAAVPVAAWAASRSATASSPVVEVPWVGEREFLAPLPLVWLEGDERVLKLLDGVGIQRCGDLAALERGAVEVRFGAEGGWLWRLSRADDPRLLFHPVPRERPHASLDFLDYTVTDPERLVFTANALLGSVCDALRRRGEHAGRLRLTLSLADGSSWVEELRPGRATASRAVWLRLLRAVLDELKLSDAVIGMALAVEATEVAAARQGDLFDPGFATAGAVEAAVLRLLESQGEVVVRPEPGWHPLLERRTRWVAETVEAVVERDGSEDGVAGDGGLALRLLPEPRPVEVETARHRGHALPAAYRDGEGWRRVRRAMGPDRVSGGQWEAAYAREYFRAVTDGGLLVWLFRDARRDAWYLHGWWE